METMLTPTIASIALLCVCVLLLIVVPIMDGSEKFAKFISLRYILVAMSLIMALGCVLDFSHLAESSRNIVLTGAVVLVSIFVIVRSLEKVKLGGKKIELTAEKGDMKAEVIISGEKSSEENQPHERKLICESADCNSDNDAAA
jgi:hypothetical protein